GDNGSDYLSAGDGNDAVTGGDGNDVLMGGADNDVLDAGAGKDTIYGEAGNDTLKSGSDNQADDLYGGAGADEFSPEWFKSGNVWANRENTHDFNKTQGDKSAASPNTPLYINFTQLDCLEETDEVGSDEPYVVFWVGNLKAPQASYTTRTSVFGDVDE